MSVRLRSSIIYTYITCVITASAGPFITYAEAEPQMTPESAMVDVQSEPATPSDVLSPESDNIIPVGSPAEAEPQMSLGSAMVDVQSKSATPSDVLSHESGNIIPVGSPYAFKADATVAVSDPAFPSTTAVNAISYNVFYSDYIPVTAGQALEGKICAKRDLKASGSDGSLFMGIERFDAMQRPIGESDGTIYFAALQVTVPRDGAWHCYKNTVSLPVTHTPYQGSDGGAVRFVRVRALVNYDSGTVPTLWGGIFLGNGNKDDVKQVATPSDVLSPESGNIIRVETPLAFKADATVAVADPAFPSTKAVNAVSYNAFYSDYIPVTAGQALEGKICAKRDMRASGSDGSLFMGIERFDAMKRPIGESDGTIYFAALEVTVPRDGVWHCYKNAVSLPVTHTPYQGSDGGAVRFVRVRAIVNYGNGTVSTLWGGLFLGDYQYDPNSVTVYVNRFEGTPVTARIYGTERNDHVRIVVDARGSIIEALGADGTTVLRSFLLPEDVMVVETDMREGDDKVDGSQSPVRLDVLGWSSQGEGNDTVIGSPFDDEIDAGEGDDTVYAGAGDDRIEGGEGNDLIHGGDGDDWIIGGWGSFSRTTDADTLYGEGGDDEIYGEKGDDYLHGGTGNDVLVGGFYYNWDTSDGNDVIIGGAGDDLLNGRQGNDTLDGEDGNDLLLGESGNDTLTGGPGADTLNGGTGKNVLISDENDVSKPWPLNIYNPYFGVKTEASSGNAYVSGMEGNNNLKVVRPSPGGPVVVQALGSDGSVLVTAELPAWTTTVYMYGRSGHDVLVIDAAADVSGILMGGGGNDTLVGGSKGDVLHGGGGKDSLIGGSGNDSLWGDEDSDTLDGGAGNDKLHGDNFYTDDRPDVIKGGEGYDFAIRSKRNVDVLESVELLGDRWF